MTSELDFLMTTNTIQKKIIKQINSMNISQPNKDDPKREGFDKFWTQMLDDLIFYEKQIDKKT